jgi:putative phage-type endonuclease
VKTLVSTKGMSREEWLEQRRRGIGCSDVPVILGISKFKTITELWEEKTGRRPLEQRDNPDMQRGRTLEPIIADIYAEKTGRTVRRVNAILQHPKYPFLLANLDRKTSVPDNPDRPGYAPVEIKCPRLSVFGRIQREGVPQYYYVQLQAEMLVMGASWGSLAVFNAERWELLHFDVPADPELQEQIVSRCEQFWNKVILDTPPQEAESQPADIVDVPAVESGKLIRIENNQWQTAVNNLREAQELMREAEALEKQAKMHIQNIMDAHKAEVAEGAGARIYCSTQAGRRSFDAEAFNAAHPEIELDKFYKTGKPFRVLRAYYLKQEA